MKRMSVLLIAIILPLWAYFSVVAVAHTSDERYFDGYVIDLSTAPVAPWVGEKTGMSFVFIDPKSGKATSSVVSAVISIDALMRPGGKAPEVVFTSEEFEIKNGGFATDHIFTEVGTYDMHVQFTDKNGIKRETGFRKQVRAGNTETGGVPSGTFFVTTLLVGLLSFVAGRLWKAKT